MDKKLKVLIENNRATKRIKSNHLIKHSYLQMKLWTKLMQNVRFRNNNNRSKVIFKNRNHKTRATKKCIKANFS